MNRLQIPLINMYYGPNRQYSLEIVYAGVEFDVVNKWIAAHWNLDRYTNDDIGKPLSVQRP